VSKAPLFFEMGKKILIIRSSAMGDVAMIVPVVRTLHLQHPEAEITILTRGFFAPFFKHIPQVNIHEIQPKTKHKGLIGIFKLYAELKSYNFDVVIDFHHVLRSRIILFMFKISGIPTFFTPKNRTEKKALTRMQNKVFQPLTPIIDRHVQTLKQAGFEIDIKKDVFPQKTMLSKDCLDFVSTLPKPWIGIAPFAQYSPKVYPEDLMKEVIQGLQKCGFGIILFGGPDEKVALDNLSQDLPHVLNSAGKFDLIKEMQLLQHIAILLSMDSGNAHIAAFLGTKVLSLWGATHPYAGFTPYKQPLSNSLMANREKYPLLPTSIYGNKIIPGYEDAMRTITPEQIISKINEIIDSKKAI
jgi:ADP-heptose:LPS heptosyltransferase